jgi:hypothetical protein
MARGWRTRGATGHPTFDNIADLFVTRGLSLVPLSESALLERDWPGPPVQAIVVTRPNNPTGLVTPESHLRSLAEHAVHNGQTVIIDASFRGQVRDARYDTYAVQEAVGADWITVEDTGKLWPTHELKVGLLAYSTRTRLPIERAFSESLLSASPVILLLIAALANDWMHGGYERARALVERNRAVVRQAAQEVGLGLADPASEISVARIELPADGPDSSLLYKDVRRPLRMIDFEIRPCRRPVPAAEREATLAAPGFGQIFTDHMVTLRWSADAGWHDGRLEPYGPFTLDPATLVFHYGQEIFEGMKAYRRDGGAVALFRPEANAARFNRSARRMAMPWSRAERPQPRAATPGADISSPGHSRPWHRSHRCR